MDQAPDRVAHIWDLAGIITDYDNSESSGKHHDKIICRWIAAELGLDDEDTLMRSIFVDTSGWYPLLFSGSRRHAEMAKLARVPGTRFVTSTYVLDELVSLMLTRRAYSIAARTGSYIRSAREVRLEHPDAAEEAKAWRLFLDRPDKMYSLTDCLSFVIMRRLGISEVIATDDHFRQEGFTVLP